MTNQNSTSRTFNEQRREQGFKSQAHLDAFFRYYDHTQACAECQKASKPVWVDDCFQPTQNRCAEALTLQAASDAFSQKGGINA